MQNKKRDLSVDLCRALAIVLMVSANMAVIAEGEAAWIFRLTSSLAAPMFILLSSMMVALSYLKGKSIRSSLERSLFLITVAVLCDLANSVLPGVNVDILYFLSLSLFFVTLIARFSIPTLALLGVAVLVMSAYLQGKYSYRTEMFYALTPENIQQVSQNFFEEVPLRYMVDGWFPLFPWISVGILGLILGKLRYPSLEKKSSFAKPNHILAAFALLLVGGLLWWLFPGEQSVVHNYIELFYPATPGFIFFAMSLCYLTICLFDLHASRFWMIIEPIGAASLFMYVFHLAVITHVLMPLGKINFGVRYVLYFLLLITLMIGIGHLLQVLRRRSWYKKMPQVVRWSFG